jgi:hypothetical protein
MEVHTHPHSSPAPGGTTRKKWTHYFWEFLMLFLAVFCGFLAEYQLEHKIERDRATKYMYDMLENLKYDTIRYDRNLKGNVLFGAQLDSFRAAISKAIKGDVDGNRLYDLWLKCQNFSTVVFNKTAISQLKSSGSFRLIKNDSLAFYISDYYERKITACEEQEKAIIKMSDRLIVSSSHFFYYGPFDHLISTETNFGKPPPDSIIDRNKKPLGTNPPLSLLNTNPSGLKLLYNDVANKELAIKRYNAYLRWAKDAADELMIRVKREYHFEK